MEEMRHRPGFSSPQVNIYVEDAERSASFYRDNFGFRERFRFPRAGRPEHIELELGGLVLGFASHEAARTVHGIETSGSAPGAEIVLWTDDADAACSSLEERGVSIASRPHDFAEGLRGAWVRDADGNNIQIVQRKG